MFSFLFDGFYKVNNITIIVLIIFIYNFITHSHYRTKYKEIGY